MSGAEILVSFTIARVGEAGSAFGVGAGVTVGPGVAAGFGFAALGFAGRRGVCAATTINKRAAANTAVINLNKFIRAIFLLEGRASSLALLSTIWSTIIFEELWFGKIASFIGSA